jgi:hypothetical protein
MAGLASVAIDSTSGSGWDSATTFSVFLIFLIQFIPLNLKL